MQGFCKFCSEMPLSIKVQFYWTYIGVARLTKTERCSISLRVSGGKMAWLVLAGAGHLS